MRSGTKQITVQFECGNQTSVSWQMLDAMALKVGVNSLEDLIHYSLQKLKNDLAITHPIDDGLPTGEHFSSGEKLAPHDIESRLLSSFFDEDADGREVDTGDYDLGEMLLQVTENNMHALLNFQNTQVLDKSGQDLSTPSVHSSVISPYWNQDDISFTFQISLESIDQVKTRWRKEMKSLDNGVMQGVSKRLSFETWEDLLNIFSEEGKEMVKSLRRD